MSDPKKEKSWADEFMEDDDDVFDRSLVVDQETPLPTALDKIDKDLAKMRPKPPPSVSLTPKITNKQLMETLEEMKRLIEKHIGGSNLRNLKSPYDKYSSTLIRMEIINRGLPQDGRFKLEFVEILNLHDKVIEYGLVDQLNAKPRQSRKVMRELLSNVS